MTYGGPVPVIGASITGFVNGQNKAALTTQPTCSTVATPTSLVGGSYSSSCSGASAANYSISYVPGAVSVSPAPLKITASSSTMTFGGAVPVITASYTGFVNGEGAAALTTKPTCSTAATSHSPVGSYPSSCSGAVDGNYAFTYVSGTVTVTRAILTVTASSSTVQYGQPVTITPSYSGFVAGDTAASLTTKPTCTSTAPANSGPGTYGTSCSGAVDTNYLINYVGGTLTVTKAATTLTAAPLRKGLLTLTYSATLTRTFDGAPVGGRQVVFSTSGGTACTATTNAQGVATCTVVGLVITLGGHPTYTARFAGDADYVASTGTGAL
jgi:hypothetical protein